MNDVILLTGEKYLIKYQSEYDEKRKGGNGIVYDLVEIKNKDTGELLESNDYVVKVAINYENPTRKSRFEQAEISFLVDNYRRLKNVIEILDYDHIDYNWYLMKKYKEFDVKYPVDFLHLLQCLIEIGEAIKSIHALPGRKAHRDIKPRNILIDKNDDVLLADFGCAFIGSMFSDGLTKRPIGPYLIRPPELDTFNRNSKLDYRRSDVYLFAKTCWMYIKQNSEGFMGEYRRNDRIALYPKKHCKTFEPLHEMMERATVSDINRRDITIEECIAYLKIQMKIVDGTIQRNILQKMISKENNSRVIEEADIKAISLVNTNQLVSSLFSKHNCCIPFVFVNSIRKDEIIKLFFEDFELRIDSDGKIIINGNLSEGSLYSKVAFAVDNVVYNKVEEKIVISFNNSKELNYGSNVMELGSTYYFDSGWFLEIDNKLHSLDYLTK